MQSIIEWTMANGNQHNSVIIMNFSAITNNCTLTVGSHTISHSSVVNNKQCSHQYPPCNPIKTWPKWDHYDCGSPKSISAELNYHGVARVQEQSCTLSLIERSPPSQLSSLNAIMLSLMDLIKYYAPCSLNVPLHIFLGKIESRPIRGQLWLSGCQGVYHKFKMHLSASGPLSGPQSIIKWAVKAVEQSMERSIIWKWSCLILVRFTFENYQNVLCHY